MKEIWFNIDNKETYPVLFLVGDNAQDNFRIIDNAQPDDFWYHCNNFPSCHIISKIPQELEINKKGNKKIKNQILKKGCLLIKENTNSLKKCKEPLEIIVSKIKDLEKLTQIGSIVCKNIYKTYLI